MGKQQQLLKTFALALCALFVFLSLYFGGGGVHASADVESYSDVVEDLSKDENFNVWDYPAAPTDYSLRVIQIAESGECELFIYVYQPSGQITKFTATCINMSLSETVTGTKLYDLTLINSRGVFFKYRVDGLTVDYTQSLRYYNISSIYRAYNSFFDEGGTNGNDREEIAFSVGQLWNAQTDGDGETVYGMTYTEVVRIINPYVGFATYTEEKPWFKKFLRISYEKYQFCDSHYIAFSTDYDIDRLISADVSYVYCPADGYYDTLLLWDWGELNYGDEVASTVTVSYDQKTDIVTSSFFKGTHLYSWDRIQTAGEFLETEENLTEEERSVISGSQWVLRFLETERTQKETKVGIWTGYSGTFTKVFKVSILRLEFEMDGKVYNLGTVNDKISAEYPEAGSWFGSIFGNDTDGGFSMPWWGWTLIAVGAVFVIVLVVTVVRNGKDNGG